MIAVDSLAAQATAMNNNTLSTQNSNAKNTLQEQIPGNIEANIQLNNPEILVIHRPTNFNSNALIVKVNIRYSYTHMFI